jgi:hypothetical protein
MEAYPSAETLKQVVKKLKIEKYEKIFDKITNKGWWSKINLVKRNITNALIDFMQVEMKFPCDEIESEESEEKEKVEEVFDNSNAMAMKFANAMAKSILNKIQAKSPEDRLNEQEGRNKHGFKFWSLAPEEDPN